MKTGQTAKEWKDRGNLGGPNIDAQWTTADSVCVDPDAPIFDRPSSSDSSHGMQNGILKCLVQLDETGWKTGCDIFMIFPDRQKMFYFVPREISNLKTA